MPAHEFGGVRVALLWHDRAARRPGIGERDEAERLRRPDHDFLCQPRQVQRALHCGCQIFDGEITVTDAVKRIGGGAVKAECLRRHIAVDREPCPGQCGTAQRTAVQPRTRIGKAAPIARKHLDISHQMMAERHGLRALQMRKARHHGVGMVSGAGQQRVGQRNQPRIGRVNRIAHPQAEIGRDLIVARPRGVQAPGYGADQRGELCLGRHVDVFERDVIGHAVRRIIRRDRRQPVRNRLRIRCRQDALRAKHRDMRLRSGNVLPPHPLVERQRGIYRAHDGVRPFAKAPAPHWIGVCLARANRLDPHLTACRLR